MASFFRHRYPILGLCLFVALLTETAVLAVALLLLLLLLLVVLLVVVVWF
jgi:hypothetical protein